ncbi:hypothetical protein TcWFU_004387 [Taenia crassiceps]|uniref:Uncharacterized protein n=1 Tax=Taenia crassiceps TaxID=6207 RepID=A0ABR4QAN0_9CEST
METEQIELIADVFGAPNPQVQGVDETLASQTLPSKVAPKLDVGTEEPSNASYKEENQSGRAACSNNASLQIL